MHGFGQASWPEYIHIIYPRLWHVKILSVGGIGRLLAMTEVSLELSCSWQTMLSTTQGKARSVWHAETIFVHVLCGRIYLYIIIIQLLVHMVTLIHSQLAGILKPYKGECLLDPSTDTSPARAVEFTRWREVVRTYTAFYLFPSCSHAAFQWCMLAPACMEIRVYSLLQYVLSFILVAT